MAERELRSVALLNDTARRANPGCQLTSQTLRTVLQQSSAELGWRLDIKPHPWRFAKRLDTGDRILRRLLASGRAFEKEALWRLSLVEYGQAAVADAIAADFVVFQPEGTVSDGDDFLKILRLLSLPLYLANFENKSLVVMNGTFPLISDERGSLVEWLRASSTAFVLRDRLSAAHWKGDFMHDTALSWSGRRALADNFILITTGAEVSKSIDRHLIERALEVCRRTGSRPLVATKGWRRFLFAKDEVRQLGGEFHEDVDLERMDELLLKCRLHIGGRYHMAILAATKGVPSVLIRTNTHKNEWLAQELEGVSCCKIEKVVLEAMALLERGDEADDLLIKKTREIAQNTIRQCTRLLGRVGDGPENPARAPTVPLDLRWRVRKDHISNFIKTF